MEDFQFSHDLFPKEPTLYYVSKGTGWVGWEKMAIFTNIEYSYMNVRQIYIFFKISNAQHKGHLISKANYGLPTSSKKRTDEFDLFFGRS